MGPLHGMRVVEIAGIGPGPFCAMLLADLGAEVIRIDRAAGGGRPIDIDPRRDITGRGRQSLALDLKNPGAVEIVLQLCSRADALIEGFRPGVMERLGLGPEACQARNPRLVYGRMTGWGQDGPLSQLAGHDINYLALSGSLYLMGRRGERPVAPLNAVADMGGGGLMLAFGILAALQERERSGRGQVVDAAMFEGAAMLAISAYAQMATGWWNEERGTNLLDSGAPFYEVYEAADGGYVAVGAIEPQFYALLLQGLGLDPATLPRQMDRARWPQLKGILAARIREKSRDEWACIFAGTDACVSPVLTPKEAAAQPHAVARGSFTADPFGPAPVPRFSRTPGAPGSDPVNAGEHSREILEGLGFAAAEIEALRTQGAWA